MLDNVHLNTWSETLLVIISILGLISNVVVLKIVFCPRTRSPLEADSILMIMIAIFDVIACCFALVTQFLRWGQIISYLEPLPWCYYDLIIFSTSTFATLALTSALSLVRYLVIVRGWDISWRRSLQMGIILILAVWFVILYRGLENPLLPMPSGLYCMPHAPLSAAPIGQIIVDILYSTLVLPFPFLIISCYALVTLHYHRLVDQGSRAVLHQSDGLVYSPSQMQSVVSQFTKTQRRNTIKLVLIIVAYVLAIGPEYIFSFLNLAIGYNRSANQDCLCFLCLFSISLINPLFVLNLHHASSHEFTRIIQRLGL